jgi:tripartite-type tricarboxylate transporter receptor subunit TctC
VILPNFYPNLNYIPLKDFAPITVIARQAPIIVVSNKIPANNIKELIAYLKANPETPYASLGNGSYPHVAMEEFQKQTGTKLLHVPYKGTAQIITDMIGGQVDLYVGTLGAFEQHEKSGKVKILATATEKRLPFRPELVTVSESGVPGFAVSVWFGMVATAGTPTPVLNKIYQDVAEILKNNVFINDVLTPQALVPGGDSRADFGALMKADTVRWGEIIKTTGIKP